MTNKTPFELRFDLLSLAQGILNEKMWAERNRLENDWQAQVETARNDKTKPPAFPKMPSVEPDEIVELAKKLNDFVSNSGDNKNA
jgi:hypothetical protein